MSGLPLLSFQLEKFLILLVAFVFVFLIIIIIIIITIIIIIFQLLGNEQEMQSGFYLYNYWVLKYAHWQLGDEEHEKDPSINEEYEKDSSIINALQDIMEIILRDVMYNGIE